jgi:methionine-rich copper-binding protein CopC
MATMLLRFGPRRRRLGAAVAAGTALMASAFSAHSAAAAGASVGVAACPGTLTWSFSSPLTLGFASGTITQSWGVGSVCAIAGTDVSTQVAVPPPDDVYYDEYTSPFVGTAPFSGSCVLANVGISSFAIPGETGLLVGGMVVVSPPLTVGPGATASEVDVLTTTTPCNETTAFGAGNDLGTLLVAG